jgi:hypothetical protein
VRPLCRAHNPWPGSAAIPDDSALALIYSAGHVKVACGLRAQMPYAPLLPTRTAASQAVSQDRVWRGRSDLSWHRRCCPLASCGRGVDRSCQDAALGHRVRGSVDLIGRQQYPSNPCVLVRQREHGPVSASPFDQGTDPLTSAVILPLGPAERRPGSVHEKFTEIAIPAFADPK